MKANPFKTARQDAQVTTIGDAIRLLTEAFSEEGSGDTMGAYILEMAYKQAQLRLPRRVEEYDKIMARIEASKEEPKDHVRIAKRKGEYAVKEFSTPTGATGTYAKFVKKGEYVRFKNTDSAPVWVRSEYLRSEKKYSFYKFDDVNQEKLVKGDKECFIGFTF